MTPKQTVERFLAALEALDIDAALALVDDSIVYENVGLPPARGRRAFEKQMRGMERYFDRFEVRMHSIAENGNTVLTERTDILEFFGARLDPWVCGTFQVENGKIVLWKDYFDWASMTAQVVKSLPALLLHPLRSRLARA